VGRKNSSHPLVFTAAAGRIKFTGGFYNSSAATIKTNIEIFCKFFGIFLSLPVG